MKLVLTIALNVLALLIVSYLIPGFAFDSFWATVVTAVLLGVANMFIKPILQIVFLPVTIITLGVGAFLINVVILWLVSFIVPGFDIASFLTAALASILLSLVSMFLGKLAKETK